MEEYFEFNAPNDIRVKGTRVGIETILYAFIHQSQSPETIVSRYPSLTLKQVYATITYYLRNQEQVDSYLADWITFSRQMRDKQAQNPPELVLKLRRRAREQEKKPPDASF